MKKLCIMLLLLAFCMSIINAQSEIVPEGSGTSGDPYKIVSLGNLLWMEQQSNVNLDANTFNGQYFKQQNDIDASATSTWNSGQGWRPINNSNYMDSSNHLNPDNLFFNGIYDGQGYVIKNLSISRSSSKDIGLFGVVGQNGQIKNLGLINVNITGNSRTGGLAGVNYGNISNCYTTGIVTGNEGIGGLVGIHANKSASSKISNSYSIVTVTGVHNVGGFIGSTYSVSSTLAIDGCYASGNVFTQYGGGGFIGDSVLIIKDCYSTGNVKNTRVTDYVTIGGFIGFTGSSHSTTNCYSTGKVTGNNDVTVINRGFIGTNQNSIHTYTNCFWDTETSGASSTGGYPGIIGKTTTQMKTQGTFTNWDFTNIWILSPTITLGGYPVLRWSDQYPIQPVNFEISRFANLLWLSQNVNSTNDKSYTQTKNIYAPTELNKWDNGKGFKPIGTSGTSFDANYEGNHYIISGLFINRPTEDYIGLFGSALSSQTIQNLTLENVNITGKFYVGALVGTNNSIINNCSVSGAVTGQQKTGGFIGYHGYSNITKSYSTATVIGSSEVGGFIGNKLSGSVYNSYSTGNVSGNQYVGGFVGHNSNYINNCYSRGNVNSISNNDLSKFGGFVGNQSSDQIINCYSTGWVKDNSNVIQNDKGFAGTNTGGSFSNCFWDVTTSQSSSSGLYSGISGKTTAEMANSSSIDNIYLAAGWDFKGELANGSTEVWNIGHGKNDGYPYFDWQYPTESATLPVTLSSFTAIYSASNTVNIQWTTQSESNMIGYHVFRSQNDNLNNSLRISDNKISANNISETCHYSFIDNETEVNNTYYYWLQSAELDGTVEFFGPIKVLTGNNDNGNPIIPIKTQLNPAYPNPFNPSTIISYDLAETNHVCIEIYNAKGQKVKQLFNKEANAGHYSIVWNGTDYNNKKVASGIYFYKMQAGKYSKFNKMLLMK